MLTCSQRCDATQVADLTLFDLQQSELTEYVNKVAELVFGRISTHIVTGESE